MDEYIKREDALDAVLFALAGTGHQSTAIYAIREVPTADVVPRSEYDNLKFQFEALDHECGRLERAESKHYDAIVEAKARLAREIFEEIDSMIFGTIIPNDCAIISIASLAELKKKYTEAENDR